MAAALVVPGALELAHKDELEFAELGTERHLLDYASLLVFMSEVLALLSFSVCGSSIVNFDRVLAPGGGIDGDICGTEQQSLSGMAGDNTGPQVPGKKMKGSATVFQCETVGGAQYDDDDEDDDDDGDGGHEGANEDEGDNADETEGVEDAGEEENEEEEEGGGEQGEEEEAGEEDEDDGDEPYEEEDDDDDEEEEEEENDEDEEPPRKRKK